MSKHSPPMAEIDFHKQPVARVGVTSVPTSVDSDGGHSDGVSDHAQAPVSLLSTLIHAKQSSSHRSPPSTAMSSPSGRIEPTPILRRDSISASDAEGIPALTMSALSNIPSRRCALKFAVASHPSHPPPLIHPEPDLSDSEGSDLGYQEDEEDGAFSDDDDYPSHIPPGPTYPFARPTNYHCEAHSPSPPPAPAVLPPPPRRGRGHVQVNDPAPPPKTCSRHCSPPPSRSRSTSRRSSHVSDAGPRKGRAGSPMPDVTDLASEDDSEEEGPPNNQLVARSTELESQIQPVYQPSVSVEPASSMGEGMRNFFRRASEHLPGFRRPSIRPLDDSGIEASDDDEIITHGSTPNLMRARSLGAKVTFDTDLPRRDRPRRVISQVVSADEGRRPRPVQCVPRRREQDVVWSDEAVL